MKTILVTAALILFSLPTLADEPLHDPAQEARAVALGKDIRCVVCQSESINDSQADMARTMRTMIREKIHEGWSDQQVYDYVRGRYGDFVLLRPPFQQNTWLLWLGPALLILGAGIWITRTLRWQIRKKENL